MPDREPNFLREALSQPHDTKPFVPLGYRPAHPMCILTTMEECVSIPISERCDFCHLRAR